MVVPSASEPVAGSPELFPSPDAAGGPTTWTVAELSAHLSRLLAAAFPGDLWVQGQLRNLSRPESGHVYFDLVEPAAAGDTLASVVSVVLLAPEKRMVNDVLRRTGGAVRMVDGIEIRIRGRLRWWAPRGQLQLRMTSIDPAWTLGRLAADRERVLAALAAEGLVDRNRSRPMPPVPLRVGLVTSIGSAAHADFLAELRGSSYGFEVVLADARTQGPDCERSVVSALHTLASAPAKVDVIALVRGGGARTDLAAFDRAGIARAIAEVDVAVLTGIGHEIDSSIADLVASRSFKTPTAVAAHLVERVRRFLDRADELCVATAAQAERKLTRADDLLDRHGRRIARATRSALSGQERVCSDIGQRLVREPRRSIDRAQVALTGVEARVRAHDPVRVLARGWSITRDARGEVVWRVSAVSLGATLLTTLTDGTVVSKVTEVSTDDP